MFTFETNIKLKNQCMSKDTEIKLVKKTTTTDRDI